MGQAGTYRTVEACIRRYIGTDGKPGEYVVAVERYVQLGAVTRSELAREFVSRRALAA